MPGTVRTLVARGSSHAETWARNGDGKGVHGVMRGRVPHASLNRSARTFCKRSKTLSRGDGVSFASISNRSASIQAGPPVTALSGTPYATAMSFLRVALWTRTYPFGRTPTLTQSAFDAARLMSSDSRTRPARTLAGHHAGQHGDDRNSHEHLTAPPRQCTVPHGSSRDDGCPPLRAADRVYAAAHAHASPPEQPTFSGKACHFGGAARNEKATIEPSLWMLRLTAELRFNRVPGQRSKRITSRVLKVRGAVSPPVPPAIPSTLSAVKVSNDRHRRADISPRTFVPMSPQSNLIDALSREARHAGRALLRSPAFSLIAFATLAIGIGATTAIYTVLDAVALRPLPYRNVDRLVSVLHPATVPGNGESKWGMSAGGYFYFQERKPIVRGPGRLPH